MAMTLGKRDWILEAVVLIAQGGTARVAVEPLAKRLGATKGSFYWHFANRDELVAETLAHGEREFTDGPIALVERIPDPLARITALLEGVMADDRVLARPTSGCSVGLRPAGGAGLRPRAAQAVRVPRALLPRSRLPVRSGPAPRADRLRRVHRLVLSSAASTPPRPAVGA